MCGSKNNQNSFCCPEAKVFTEEISGVLRGPITDAVWTAPTPSDYFQGSFGVLNTGNSPFTFSINSITYDVPPGNTITISVNNPQALVVTLGPEDTGKFCIYLYKRVFV